MTCASRDLQDSAPPTHKAATVSRETRLAWSGAVCTGPPDPGRTLLTRLCVRCGATDLQ